MHFDHTKRYLRPVAATCLLALTLGLAACGGDEEEAAAEATTTDSATAERSADSMLDTRFDGSSQAAFETDLMAFEQSAPEKEVMQLRSAIDFLLVYDIGSRGNKAKLYQRLDGMNAQEIIDAASEQKRRKR